MNILQPPKMTVEFDIQSADVVGQCHLCDGTVNATYPVYMMIVTIKNQVTTFRFCKEHFEEFGAEIDTFLMGYEECVKLQKEMKKDVNPS